MQNRIFSIDSPKAIKAQAYGFINAIHYLAPSDLSGTNLCSHSSAGCVALCLGWMSGQAGMVADLATGTNSVRESRIAKAQRFIHDRTGYVADVLTSIDRLVRQARKAKKRLCVRLNGSSDIAWEGVRFRIVGSKNRVKLDPKGQNFFELFPEVDFVDYTKNVRRFDRQLPANYHLTLSRSEINENQCVERLNKGVNVAVVFAGNKPAEWNGFTVIDGDKHDLRQLDPKGPRGTVIGLSPKGRLAKRDQSGFVVH